MNGDITEQPLAKAVLKHLAGTRGSSDPLGSFARTVLSGEATLRGAANFPWHSDALATAAAKAQQEQQKMTPEQRAEYDRTAQQLRENQDQP
ncbi:acyl-CoA reductase-like NAD-dependent aldehyde dehydrogenase [Actinoplanes tereljensis]|uniref:Uncharacterized protein n=1 Tax=Paractinoplanes tereljensis TaxID=571912 RepID=A0A919NSK0_9ACTN|nr:hypothetical protein [Actinoplanes tereljensis]GIF23490.1 hypothetical protein Ate02nite_62200 [Actinoplanes tereljensis]